MKPTWLALIAVAATTWIVAASANAAELSGGMDPTDAITSAAAELSVGIELFPIAAGVGTAVEPVEMIAFVDHAQSHEALPPTNEFSRSQSANSAVMPRDGRDQLDDSVVSVFSPKPAGRQPIGMYVLLISAVGCALVALEFRQDFFMRRRAPARSAIGLLNLPEWSQVATPRSIAAFGLRMPCTEEQLKEAYRAKVKVLHPDHGGDARCFIALQSNFEDALRLVLRVRRPQPQFAYSQAA